MGIKISNQLDGSNSKTKNLKIRSHDCLAFRSHRGRGVIFFENWIGLDWYQLPKIVAIAININSYQLNIVTISLMIPLNCNSIA